jgi:hypothetical protein
VNGDNIMAGGDVSGGNMDKSNRSQNTSGSGCLTITIVIGGIAAVCVLALSIGITHQGDVFHPQMEPTSAPYVLEHPNDEDGSDLESEEPLEETEAQGPQRARPLWDQGSTATQGDES